MIHATVHKVEKACYAIGQHPGWIIAASNFLIIFAFIVGYIAGKLDFVYDEHGIGTYYSATQIFLISASCFFMYRALRRDSEGRHEKANIWRLGAIGFLYLFFDEIAQIHEKLDFTIHYLFIGQGDEFTDHIDDFIVFIYIIFGMLFLIRHSAVFMRDLRYRKTYALALLLLLGMALTDLRPDLLAEAARGLVADQRLSRINALPGFLEDSLKIWGGALILVAVSGTYVAEKRAHDPGAERV